MHTGPTSQSQKGALSPVGAWQPEKRLFVEAEPQTNISRSFSGNSCPATVRESVCESDALRPDFSSRQGAVSSNLLNPKNYGREVTLWFKQPGLPWLTTLSLHDGRSLSNLNKSYLLGQIGSQTEISSSQKKIKSLVVITNFSPPKLEPANQFIQKPVKRMRRSIFSTFFLINTRQVN